MLATSCSHAPAIGNGGTGGTGASGSTGGSMATGNSTGSSQCPPCMSPSDCSNGQICAQLGADSSCAPACSNNQCPAGQACEITTDTSGNQVSVCVVPGSLCSDVMPTTTTTTSATNGVTTSVTSSTSTGNEMCGSYVGPDISAMCHSCSGASCQVNGCYGGWWCDTATNKCHAPPTNCGSTSATTSTTTSTTSTSAVTSVTTGGGTGTVGPNGGSVASLYFTVVGDTRPPVIGDTSGYPTAIAKQIYTDIQNRSPMPLFSVSTGDYMFASVGTTEATAQLNLYLSARNLYSGMFFPAMGNHECTGATNSNCGTSGSGMTTNYNAFMSQLLGPIQKTTPYYSININDTAGQWTSKFVFIAANAWDSAQASWLTSTMSQPTTYTFVIRHEPKAVGSGAPGVNPSEAIMAQYPYTLAIMGHTHTYNKFLAPKQIVIGNGGAPLTGGVNYGYGLVTQRADGAIVVDMIDYQSGASDPSFHFVVTPAGQLTQ